MNRLLPVFLLVMLAGCSSAPPAPVEERSTVITRDIQLEPDGRYRVRKGDSLWMIAFHFGLDHQELARWNNISAPFVIFPGQLLTVEQPPVQSRVQTRPARPPVAEPTRPAVKSAAEPGPATTPAQQPSSTPPAARPPVTAKPGATANVSEPQWQWPTEGRLLRNFLANNPARGGFDIAGTQGQQIVAAASGRVVYSGSGLIGYGELIIIKHNDRLLSAYAHNQRRLVTEGDVVEAGQVIAEMGRNDRNEVILHFEIRVDGRPVDPAGYLPDR